MESGKTEFKILSGAEKSVVKLESPIYMLFAKEVGVLNYLKSDPDVKTELRNISVLMAIRIKDLAELTSKVGLRAKFTTVLKLRSLEIGA